MTNGVDEDGLLLVGKRTVVDDDLALTIPLGSDVYPMCTQLSGACDGHDRCQVRNIIPHGVCHVTRRVGVHPAYPR